MAKKSKRKSGGMSKMKPAGMKPMSAASMKKMMKGGGGKGYGRKR